MAVIPRRRILRRVGWAVGAIFLAMTTVFVLVAFTQDPNQAVVEFAAVQAGENASAAAEPYRRARNLDVPAGQRYVSFLADLATLQLGRSFETGRPVRAILIETGAVTAAYVVPAVVLSALVGGAVGLYAAVRWSRPLDRFSGVVAYVGLGVPAFWLAVLLATLVSEQTGTVFRYHRAVGPLAPENRWYVGFTALVLATTLLPAQLRNVRSEAREYAHADFVKTARAKGAGLVRVGRHTVRNAMLPLLSLFVSDVLGVLFLTGFVLEVVLGVPGLGLELFQAVDARDVPVVMGITLVIVVFGVVATLLQDLLRTAIDPRIEG